jgi:DNA-binding SARP family transcriptional activator
MRGRTDRAAISADQPTIELRVLGPIEARVGGASIELGPPKQRALLVHLLLHANKAVSTERLIDELWPEDPPETARHAIQVYVSGLRKALGDPARIAAHGRSYALRLEPRELDLERFRSLVDDARAQLGLDPAATTRRLHEALSLWRGRALADLDGEPAVRDIVLDLEEERLDATELRVEAELALGRHTAVVPELERLLSEHPARERLYGHLMLALYRSGRQADALDVYRRARTRLGEELGLEPSPRLRGLQASVLRQDPSLAVEPPELRARRHLPAQPDALIGRERELSELTELVASAGVRLVTLTGPRGVGKTRLAIAAAERLAASFPDGVWFVDLCSVRETVQVLPGVARALGIQEEAGGPPEDALPQYLRDKELLLVLDPFEHLLQAALLVSSLVRAAPRVKLLITSRERLNLYGEHQYDLPPLGREDLHGGR